MMGAVFEGAVERAKLFKRRDGALGAYLNCKLSARNSDTFKTKWATQAAGWQTKKEQLEMKRIASGCDKN